MGYIRFLLAISVFQGHAWAIFPPKVYEFSGGVVSVRLFYIISGYLIAIVLTNKYSSLKNFYISRSLRLLPAYYFILIISIITSVIFFIFTKDSFLLGYFVGYKDILNKNEMLFLSMPQLTTLFLDLYGFIGINHDGLFLTKQSWNNINGYQFLIIPQAWTLGIECWFYLLAPFALRNKFIPSILLGLSISVEFFINNSFSFSVDDPWARRFFPTEMQYFLLGIIACQNRKKLIIRNELIKISLAASLFSYLFLMEFVGIANQYFIYILFAILIPSILQISEKLPFDRYIGDLSYPFYISHMFCLNLVSNINNEFHYPKILSFIISLMTSIFIVRFIERYFNNLRHKFN
jgi:peptidoglycan/LPS O-acetylase OafA/YrhL